MKESQQRKVGSVLDYHVGLLSVSGDIVSSSMQGLQRASILVNLPLYSQCVVWLLACLPMYGEAGGRCRWGELIALPVRASGTR